jgi:hypothetical protein
MIPGIVLGVAGGLVLLPFVVRFIAFAFSDKRVWLCCSTTSAVNPRLSNQSLASDVAMGLTPRNENMQLKRRSTHRERAAGVWIKPMDFAERLSSVRAVLQQVPESPASSS